MSKAEERALEVYPIDIVGYYSDSVNSTPLPMDGNEDKRQAYQDGYEQAEKDIKEGIWHKSNESPIIGKTILLVAPDGSPSLCLWNGKSLLSATIHGGHLAFCEGDKWCYIKDI